MRPVPRPRWMPPAYHGEIPSIITNIRQLPSGVAPTLENIPQLDHLMIEDDPLSSLVWDMQTTDFKQLGFVIFRTVYTDESQPLWGSYPLLKWTIIEDRETLDNASKQHVRERFSEWASQHSVERDGPGVEEALQQKFPRFRYCIYVDKKCLDTVAKYEAWAEAGAQSVRKKVVCAVLDKNCHRKGEGEGRYRRIEGCSREYTGWQYTSVNCLADLYDRLSKQELSGYDYMRPPMVFPADGPMPVD
ncbi:hypothetical protein FLAG1_05389 [Fusarium langsethiae]|uniref:Uncharacterized protein n=1 Tax=Fusarium langsethiae TaxID=179993 RepID=A0A0M9EX72_FUSLA|nr:hypothetical protein FLAG1_05389 [Fusarium langsethiae]GKU02998.1 unnamed protein product [Fusarium langsethiae]GKU18410.1 unnamed protein product [Fusarium langsethiae]